MAETKIVEVPVIPEYIKRAQANYRKKHHTIACSIPKTIEDKLEEAKGDMSWSSYALELMKADARSKGIDV